MIVSRFRDQCLLLNALKLFHLDDLLKIELSLVIHPQTLLFDKQFHDALRRNP